MCLTEENENELLEQFPVQAKEAEMIRETLASSYVSTITNLSPLATLVKLSTKTFVELKINRFKLKIQAFDQGLNLKHEDVNQFLSELSEEERDWLEEYLMETLFAADEREKCKLYGFIFHEMVLRNITKNQAKRLIYAIQNTFIEDLRKLISYESNKVGDDEVSTPLQNAGLLINNGFEGGVFMDADEQGASGTVYALSAHGALLLEILEKHKWFSNGD